MLNAICHLHQLEPFSIEINYSANSIASSGYTLSQIVFFLFCVDELEGIDFYPFILYKYLSLV